MMDRALRHLLLRVLAWLTALGSVTLLAPMVAGAACHEPTVQQHCCCPQANGACHMTCADSSDVQPTVAAPAPHPTVVLAALSHAPQAFLAAASPASRLEVQAPAAIPKHYLRTHTLRL